MYSAKSLLVSLTVVAMILCFQNCQVTRSDNQGTETGNSFSPGSNPSTPEDSVGTTVAMELVSALCVRSNQCNPSIQLTECQTTLLSQSSLPEQFGISQNLNVATMQDLVNSEASGGVTTSPSKVDACLSEIAVTPCASASLQEGYSASTNTFPGIPSVIGQAPDCQAVY